MSKEHDKIGTRLAKIIEYLNSGHSVNVQELADEFNVGVRTIQKDINVRLSSLPIQKNKTRYQLEKSSHLVKGATLTKEYDKLSVRLVEIIKYLNNGQSVSVQELAEEFNVGVRTIQKDINERLSFLPIKKDKTRYYLEEFYLGKLNYQDIKNFATLSSIRGLYPSLDESFLKNLLDSTINSAYVIKGQSYENDTISKEMFSFFEKAINNHEEVELRFLSLSLSLGRRQKEAS